MKRVDFVKCPLCAHTKTIDAPKREQKGEVLFGDFIHAGFIQIREGGGKVGTGQHGRGHGRGYGFPIVSEFTLEQVLHSHMNEYGVVVGEMKDALIKVVKEAKRLGLISDSDLK